ncbi:ABC transporter ATP-binding protein [Erysipelothrix sp. HDW6C]|uniref:ABC transporter ATP-binding protein n=1 Tax=Erysipelothrix sp. HDW6C TaxID=2714930 RepID=UPI00140A0C7B|nr:ABC transporter ATP-binding protein [Erysipelothrix sp. HDW6C]QIK69057.1 ABC transporter ATP-binding protein [Erysipelothrix sp. HDW6C]
MIQFINVNKRYENKSILEDISISIPPGTILGLVGRNGAGKSTLLRLICGVLQADAGIVAYHEENVYDNPNAKKEIFFVSDDAYFMTKASILEMKQFYRVFYKNFSEERFFELIRLFGLKQTDTIASFSKGMKRHVSLALGIASRTKVLLLDEAFDGLDPTMRFKIRQIISEEVSTYKRTVVISSHNLQELADICDSVAIMDNKRIRLNYTQEDIITHYHKYRIAFAEPIDPALFAELTPIFLGGKAKIFTMIVKGCRETTEHYLNSLNPLLLERDDVSLDEIFMYEMGGY